MRLGKILPLLLILFLIVLGGWRLSHYLASKHQAFQAREFAQAHPLLYWLGPNQSATQNGYTLVAIQDAGQPFHYQETSGPGQASYQYGGDANLRGDTVLWLQVIDPPANLQFDSSRDTGRAHTFTLNAHLSSGETFPMDWEYSPSQPGPFLHAILPAGYPNTVQWVAVTVDDHRGHRATWRVNHLPPMQHVLASTTPIQNTYRNGGIRITARAWREYDKRAHQVTVMYEMRGQIRPYRAEWTLWYQGYQLDWEPAATVARHDTIGYGFSTTGETQEISPLDESEPQRPRSFMAGDHYLRLFCRLQQSRPYSETVTFHNVPLKTINGAVFLAPGRPLTQTTPSGITVTLPGVAAIQNTLTTFLSGSRGSINYIFQFTPGAVVGSLPHSPLYQKYRKMVNIRVSAKLPKGYDWAGSESTGNVSINYFKGPKPYPSLLKSFTFTVQQSVDLRAIPMTFTVPIGAHR